VVVLLKTGKKQMARTVNFLENRIYPVARLIKYSGNMEPEVDIQRLLSMRIEIIEN
jgi:hypothetical protein